MAAEGALAAQPTHKAGVTALGVSQGGRLLVQGYSNGVVRVSEAEIGSNNITGKRQAVCHLLCNALRAPAASCFAQSALMCLFILAPALVDCSQIDAAGANDIVLRHSPHQSAVLPLFPFFLNLPCLPSIQLGFVTA